MARKVSKAVLALWAAAIIMPSRCNALHPEYVLADVKLIGATQAGET
jgi:hypothetical protein